MAGCPPDQGTEFSRPLPFSSSEKTETNSDGSATGSEYSSKTVTRVPNRYSLAFLLLTPLPCQSLRWSEIISPFRFPENVAPEFKDIEHDRKWWWPPGLWHFDQNSTKLSRWEGAQHLISPGSCSLYGLSLLIVWLSETPAFVLGMHTCYHGYQMICMNV